MLMSVISPSCECVVLPELLGARVLITGLTPASGFDIARTFADQGARLIIQSPDDTPEMTELVAVLAESGTDMRLFNTPLETDEDARKLVQAAVQDFGGVDAVVNIVSVAGDDVRRIETFEDVDALVGRALHMPLRVTEAAANRMRLVWVEGSILNIVRVDGVKGGRGAMLSDMLRAEMAELTRGLAQDWAEHGIRVNAVAPPTSIAALTGDTPASDADLAAIAVQLASRAGRSVSGHVVDASGAARRWC